MYLFIYNSVQFLGWLYCLYQVVLETKTLEFNNRRLWSKIKLQLFIFQTLQFVEVIHCMVGLVPSNPIVTLKQAFTKIFIIWAIIFPFTSPQNSIGIYLSAVAWSIGEITRYLYYTLNIINKVPYVLIWCRYSFFYVLYPIGVAGELLIIYSSLDEISKNPSLSYPLPNFLNISVYYHICLMVFMLLYIPLFPPMYLHLVSQRRKIIGGSIDLKGKLC